jgi:hypothetical protein
MLNMRYRVLQLTNDDTYLIIGVTMVFCRYPGKR